MKILVAFVVLGLVLAVSARPARRQAGEAGKAKKAKNETHTIETDPHQADFPEPSMKEIIAHFIKLAKGESYFTSMDTDMSGVLSREEFAAAVMGLDADGDGYLTEEEYTSAVDLAAKQIEQALALDTDGDGLISTAELIAFLGIGGPKPDEDMTEAEFEEEVADAAAKELRRRAAEGGVKGKAKGKARGKAQDASKADKKAKKNKKKASKGKSEKEEKKPVETDDEGSDDESDETDDESEENGGDMVDHVSMEDIFDEMEMLNITEGILFFISMDIDGDGLVTREEVDQSFDQMDMNDDGELQKEEYLMSLGMLNGLVATFLNVDSNDDGVIDGHEVLFAAIHKPILAEEVNAPMRRKKRSVAEMGPLNMELLAAYNISIDEILFDVYDINGDGEITKSEYVKIFMAKDVNKDGVLSREELSQAFGQIAELISGFFMLDANYDGVINFREFEYGVLAMTRHHFMPEEPYPEPQSTVDYGYVATNATSANVTEEYYEATTEGY